MIALWPPIGAGSVFKRLPAAHERHHDHRCPGSRFPDSLGAEPDFHSRRDCLFGQPAKSCFRPSSEASRGVGGHDEVGFKIDAGAYAPASEVVGGDGKSALSKRRRATLPASAPPPIPSGVGLDYALGNGTATKRAPSAV